MKEILIILTVSMHDVYFVPLAVLDTSFAVSRGEKPYLRGFLSIEPQVDGNRDGRLHIRRRPEAMPLKVIRRLVHRDRGAVSDAACGHIFFRGDPVHPESRSCPPLSSRLFPSHLTWINIMIGRESLLNVVSHVMGLSTWKTVSHF